ncbi:MAG TPA: sulfite exporter TauE/SafE family protein [Solirubrobacteraceae bacterium]|nr:sulfite exporter TauE/SafE family protein [Solirubrobacteraceae bacterium]
MSWQWPAGAACGFLIALITAPAGVSGAVLLLPVQLSVLRVPIPAVTPTNLLFNVVAVPGSLLRFRHEHRLFNPLSALLIAGTLPGVVSARSFALSTSRGDARSCSSLPVCLCPSACGSWSALNEWLRAAPSRAGVVAD